MKLKYIFAMTVLLLSQAAFSSSTSLCWDNDCRTQGWTETRDDKQTDFQCIRNNCSTNGWITGLAESGSYYSCKNSNCETEGFYEIKRNSQQLISQTICNDGDCTTQGSLTYSPQGIIVTTCKEDDCLHVGKQSTLHGLIIEDISCINHDCMQFGWKNYK